MNQCKTLASLSFAALVAVLSSHVSAAEESAIPKCGFTRALRIIESIENVRERTTGATNPLTLRDRPVTLPLHNANHKSGEKR
ncbi:MAG: hypothetical protein ACREV2_16425 [Burkholderiales bacterium]